MSDSTDKPSKDDPFSDMREPRDDTSVSIGPELYVGYAAVVAVVWLGYVLLRLATSAGWIEDASSNAVTDRLVMLDQLQGIAWGLTAIFVLWTGVQIVRALNRND